MQAQKTIVVPSGLLLNEKEVPSDAAAENDEAEVVEEIGKIMGLTYEEDEPLRAGPKEEERDEHRWELDPASSEDYRERTTRERTRRRRPSASIPPQPAR